MFLEWLMDIMGEYTEDESGGYMEVSGPGAGLVSCHFSEVYTLLYCRFLLILHTYAGWLPALQIVTLQSRKQ